MEALFLRRRQHTGRIINVLCCLPSVPRRSSASGLLERIRVQDLSVGVVTYNVAIVALGKVLNRTIQRLHVLYEEHRFTSLSNLPNIKRAESVCP